MTAAQPQPLGGSRLVLAAVALALANFVVILDTTITNVSVPHIAGGLAISPTQGTWTITSYAVAEAITVPLTGWLAARFGTYRTLMVSLTGFALFSVLCGVARTIELLVVFRILQGLSGGPLMPLTQTLLMRVYPPEKMSQAMALWGVTTICAPIFGPLIGGYISDNWSWPWIFYINLPVIAICLFLVNQLIAPFETETKKERIDVIGLVLLVIWVGSFQLMLDIGREHDWFASTGIVALAIIAVVGFIAFVIWELTDTHPVVDLRVFRYRSLWVGTIGIAMGFGGLFSMIVLVPLWLQSVIGYTASESGHAMALVGVFAVCMAPVVGKLMQKFDPRICITGGMMWLVGVSMLRMSWTTEGSFWDFALPQLLQGFGMPFFFIGLMSFAMSSVPTQDTASAAGLLSFMRTVSGAIGTALAASWWDDATRESRDLLVGSLNGAQTILTQLQATGMSAVQARAVIERLVDAQAATLGVGHVFGIGAIILFIAAWLPWLAPRPKGNFMAGAGPGH
ncbi:DHA2 family efflux MFS transporter permease subunit [Chakrabartia godavariana]|nr:DHA2 family efflux MFS transporter permease subunit [Chakrabartia godavariana]